MSEVQEMREVQVIDRDTGDEGGTCKQHGKHSNENGHGRLNVVMW